MNLRAIAEAMAIYAAQNDNALPSGTLPLAGSWICDQPPAVVAKLMGAMSGPSGQMEKMFTCPANADSQIAVLRKSPPFYTVTGYIWLNDRGPGVPALPTGGVVPLSYHHQWNGPVVPGSTEIGADWIISQTANPAAIKWDGITAAGRPGPYDTSHMATDTTPRGGNILYMDGHVSFEIFKPTAIPIHQRGGASAPYFWLPR